MCVSRVTLQVHLYIFVCLNLTWHSIRNQSARCSLHEARTRSAWGRKKEKKFRHFSFFFPSSHVSRDLTLLSEGLQWSLCTLPLNRLTFLEMFWHWNLSREEAVTSTIYFSARIEGFILWKNSLCNHRFSRYHFQRHYFYSYRNLNAFN